MLVLLVAFKMLEMHARRDLFVVVFLCFFLVLTNFFYSQGIGTALMMVASVLLLLTAQLSFQFTGAVPPLRTRLAHGRAHAGLGRAARARAVRRVPAHPGSAVGHAGRRRRRHARACRTAWRRARCRTWRCPTSRRFACASLARRRRHAQLYWRGLVLDDFDGRTWTRGENSASGRNLRLSRRRAGAASTKSRSNRRNRAGCSRSRCRANCRSSPGHELRISPQFELTADAPLASRVRYRASSHVEYALQRGPVLADTSRWLLLPYGFNPRALAAGRALRALGDPAARVDAVLRQFREQPFDYTLAPPLLGRHTVDEFLYGTRAGFCEHYSGAFVFLMRAAGVPARVVTGYQGGELNPIDGFMTVRQSDAHAWAEVWIAGRGWLRVDPTAAVAPERVQSGTNRATERPAPFGIDALRGVNPFGLQAGAWLADVRNAMGALNNGWNQWVLNYTPERQRSVVQGLQDKLLAWPFGVVLVLAGLAWWGDEHFAAPSRNRPDRCSILGLVQASGPGRPAARARRRAKRLRGAHPCHRCCYRRRRAGPGARLPARPPSPSCVVTAPGATQRPQPIHGSTPP